MNQNQLEIEIKSLLGSTAKKEEVLTNMKKHFPECTMTNKEKQLNHYFSNWNFDTLYAKLENILTQEQKDKLLNIIKNGKKHSVRTRWIDKTNKVILVIKAAIDDTTSHNWISRIEFEAVFDNMSLEFLDNLLIDSWFPYLSKWSREREEYKLWNITVAMDKNAWYWYVAEFEMVINAWDDEIWAQKELRELMSAFGAEELNQDRLERMFAFYNQNWPEYYGTEKIFNIE